MKRGIGSISQDDDNHLEGEIADVMEHPNRPNNDESNRLVGRAAGVAEANAVEVVNKGHPKNTIPFLPDAVLHTIFQFHGDSNDVVLTRKVAKQAIEDAAKESLPKLLEKFYVDNISTWKNRLLEQLIWRILEYYNKRNIRAPDVMCTNTPRLHLRWVKSTPLSTLRTEPRALGPAAVLPNGNIAFYCEDGNFRLYSISQGTFYRTSFAQGTSIPRGGLNHTFLTLDLHYSNGFLLIKHRELVRDPNNYSVWNADDLTFVRDIQAGPSKTSFVDTEHGKIFLITGDMSVLSIVSIDIESGVQDTGFSPIHLNQAGRNVVVKAGLSGQNIVVAAFVEESGPFATDGLGLYVLDRDHPMRPPEYVPCFQQTTFLKFPFNNRPGQWPFLPFEHLSDVAPTPLRAIRFNTGQDMALTSIVDNNFVKLGDRRNVIRITDTRLFVHDPNAGKEIQVDEYDIDSGKKVRTMHLGYPRRGHMLEYVDATDNVLFCVIYRNENGSFILETFPL